VKLYQLCGKDRDASFSPYGWRAKLCLLHKGLKFEEVPIRFLEKVKISHASPQTIPVLDDGSISVVDSLAIAQYLEDIYPQPSLFGGSVAKSQAPILNHWVDQTLVMGIVGLVLVDIYNCLDAENQAYFRTTREKRFGQTLEEVVEGSDDKLVDFRKSLAPLRLVLKNSPFLSGDHPLWLDYAVFGTFMWPHIVSDFQLLAEDDVIYAWRERMFDLFSGVARRAKRAI